MAAANDHNLPCATGVDAMRNVIWTPAYRFETGTYMNQSQVDATGDAYV